MIQSYTVSRDDDCYEAFPDVAMNDRGELLCVFTQCRHHGKREDVCLDLCKSTDGGRTWSPKRRLTPQTSIRDGAYNCARISRLPDGEMIILCDFVREDENRAAEQHIFRSRDGGESWSGPEPLSLTGIVPDKYRVLCGGRHAFAIHFKNPATGRLEQFFCYSDDGGKTWTKTLLAADPALDLCEASVVEVKPGVLVAFMRENSGRGLCCKKAFSFDAGTTWEGVYDTNIDACHRPVAAEYAPGKYMMTYRFMQGGKGWLGHWTQNLFAAFFDLNTALATERRDQQTRILPLSFDRSPVSDTGYSGWVRLPDGAFCVVNYQVDDAPKAYIRAIRFGMDDVILT